MSSNKDSSDSAQKSSIDKHIEQNKPDPSQNDQNASCSDGQKNSLGNSQICTKRLATFNDISQKVVMIKQQLVHENGEYLKEFGDKHLKVIKYQVLSKLDPMLEKIQKEIQHNINNQLRFQHKMMQENIIAALPKFFDFLLEQRTQEAVKKAFIRRKSKLMNESQYPKDEVELPLLQYKIQTQIESFYVNNLCKERKMSEDEQLTQKNCLLQQNTKIKHNGREISVQFQDSILNQLKDQIQEKIYQNRNENLNKTIMIIQTTQATITLQNGNKILFPNQKLKYPRFFKKINKKSKNIYFLKLQKSLTKHMKKQSSIILKKFFRKTNQQVKIELKNQMLPFISMLNY